jgi:hypothetical protein
MTHKDIIRKLILKEVEAMEPHVQSFEDDPINFLLTKYPTLKKTLEMLMTPAYKDYITGIYITAPKPTTFKIVLHNGQYFMLTFLGKAYEATIAGKKFYLQTVGERERATNAVARLLQLGNPIETEGAEGEEKVAGEEPGSGGGAPEGAPEEETPAEEEAGETES